MGDQKDPPAAQLIPPLTDEEIAALECRICFETGKRRTNADGNRVTDRFLYMGCANCPANAKDRVAHRGCFQRYVAGDETKAKCLNCYRVGVVARPVKPDSLVHRLRAGLSSTYEWCADGVTRLSDYRRRRWPSAKERLAAHHARVRAVQVAEN